MYGFTGISQKATKYFDRYHTVVSSLVLLFVVCAWIYRTPA